MVSKKARKAKAKMKQVSKALTIGKQLYFHHLKDEKNHLLAKRQTKQVKDANRAEDAEIDNVLSAVVVDVCKSMVCGFKGLSRKPHGLREHTTDNWIYSKHGIPLTVIKAAPGLFDCSTDVKVAFPGTAQLTRLEQIPLDKHALLEFVKNAPCKASESRDDPGATGFVKRVTIGFGQPQGTNPKTADNSQDAVNQHGDVKQLCYINNKSMIDRMGHELREQLAQIMTVSSQLLENDFFSKELVFHDEQRNKLYGKRFGKLFSDECDSNFEFIDLFVAQGSKLNRHMDYSNGEAIGYDHGVSYSFVVDDHRVNIIMCGRWYCDSSMEKLNAMGGNWNLVN